MDIACCDFEGVLVPEIWLAVADRHQADALRLTTRDIPDYQELMRLRLAEMDRLGLRLADVQAVVAEMQPLPGAAEFFSWLREHYQVAIISDTFYEFALPLLAKLGWPMLLSHTLELDGDGRIRGVRMRQQDPKRQCVLAFRGLNYRIVAVGDSYNDISMLRTADAAILYRPSAKVVADYPQFPIARDYDQLRAFFDQSRSTRNSGVS
ncbi:MAG: bifunctional phosphoserine phosphatase/homoserine phosphotransferase ThrH [Gammaproteobacteria bacterium]|nr:bifunctional phosphoserine phosphatase/homoserine phosphotransferase ThrH [Gammaproteobacteria bacterium]